MAKNKKLEMSNKRNKKVFITSTAIDKIPYIEYKDIDKMHYESLQYLAKQVLLISKENNNSNEVAIIYKLDKKLDIKNIGVAFGDEHNVNPASDPKAYHILNTCLECAIVVMHNHPSTSHISLMDIGYFIDSSNIKLLIMVTNKGAISYIVKLKSFDRNKSIKLFNKSVDYNNKAKNLKEKQFAVEMFLKNVNKAGLYYSNYKK